MGQFLSNDLRNNSLFKNKWLNGSKKGSDLLKRTGNFIPPLLERGFLRKDLLMKELFRLVAG